MEREILNSPRLEHRILLSTELPVGFNSVCRGIEGDGRHDDGLGVAIDDDLDRASGHALCRVARLTLTAITPQPETCR